MTEKEELLHSDCYELRKRFTKGDYDLYYDWTAPAYLRYDSIIKEEKEFNFVE